MEPGFRHGANMGNQPPRTKYVLTVLETRKGTLVKQ